MGNTVKGSARKGFRNTHGKKALPSGAKSDPQLRDQSGGAAKNITPPVPASLGGTP
jgi:hypothetical protein